MRPVRQFDLVLHLPAGKEKSAYFISVDDFAQQFQVSFGVGSYPGVDKAYAIQAGREVRVMVKPDQVSEDQMVILARELAKKIEEEMEYPGQIKVHVLRETAAIEYAK